MLNLKSIVQYDKSSYILIGINICRQRALLCRWIYEISDESIDKNSNHLSVEIEIAISELNKLKVLLER
jgi:hypothetical protein